MKKILFVLTIILVSLHSYAQNIAPDTGRLAIGVKKYRLPVVYLPHNTSLHFISPEPIQYVDISTKRIAGDLPIKNVLRIKEISDTTKLHAGTTDTDAVITIAGEKFIAQYRVEFAGPVTGRDALTDIEILPGDTRPLEVNGIGFSQPQLKDIALGLFCKRPGKAIEHAKAFGMKASLYHLYTAGDYILLDLGYVNNTRLNYAIDEFRFNVDDKKVVKATNAQSIALKPEFVLFDVPLFQKTYRNIIVLRKMTFPGNKVLHIELSEKQLSGRVITLNITYQDVLDADIIPL